MNRVISRSSVSTYRNSLGLFKFDRRIGKLLSHKTFVEKTFRLCLLHFLVTRLENHDHFGPSFDPDYSSTLETYLKSV